MALALLAVTAALAVLLAVRYHLTGPTVAVAILGTVPALAGLYLAWAAVPGAISPPEPGVVNKPAFGRLAGQWVPEDLGVHQVIDHGPMPAYVRRPHDDLLRAVLDPAVAASRLVVLRGGSSTGKSRAAYEAVVGRLADWQLDYPLNAAALAVRLEAGIPARTVLWLGELRQYADDAGGAAVVGRLADLLLGEGHLVVTTVWREQWTAYTAAAKARSGPADPAGAAGRLLERLPELTGTAPAQVDPARGGVIDVPPEFTGDDLDAAAATSDPVLADAVAAAAAAGQDGQVAQYLAGVPDLRDRYASDGGDPYGQAVITAAMDAARLGHASPLPAALIQEAAVGYLTGAQRTKPIATWRGTALDWAAAELRGAVRAVQPIALPSGTGVAGYQVADYLDQYGRRARQDQLGPASLWDALITHTASASDLDRLALAAQARGLYRHAAALWTTAATLGSTYAAAYQLIRLRGASSGDTMRAAQWAATHVRLDDPEGVADLLRELEAVGVGDAVTVLLARDPAGHVCLDDPEGVAALLRALGEAGAGDAVIALLARDPARHVCLDDPEGVADLLRALQAAGAGDAVTALLARDPAGHVRLDYPKGVAWLLGALRAADAGDAVTVLLARDPVAHVRLDYPGAVAELLCELDAAGISDAVTALLARDPAAGRVCFNDPEAIAELLRELRAAVARDAGLLRALGDAGTSDADLLRELLAAGASDAGLLRALDMAAAVDAVAALAIRAAAHVRLDDPWAVAALLEELLAAGAGDAVTALLARDPAAHVRLDDPGGVAELLENLDMAGASDAVTALATRATAHVRLDDPGAVATLLRGMGEAGASDTALLARDPAGHVRLDDPGGVAWLLRTLDMAGAGNAVTALLARDPAAHVRLDDPGAVAALLRELGEAGASDAVTVLLARDPAGHVCLDDPKGVADLLRALQAAGAGNAVTALLARDPAAHVRLDDPQAFAGLLRELNAAGVSDAVTALAIRAADAGMFDLVLRNRPDEASSYPFGREPDGTPSQSWHWQEPAS